MLNSYRYDVGAMHRKKFMVRMDELGLTYREHRGLLDSVLIVQTYTEADERAARQFDREARAYIRQLEAIDRAVELEEIARKERKELARINRKRRLTFRKPLAALPR